jgi:hypothetical protein
MLRSRRAGGRFDEHGEFGVAPTIDAGGILSITRRLVLRNAI